LCALLDGVPLALELAASRVAVLGLDAVVDRLASGSAEVLDAAPGDDRHATLTNLVEWSMALLSHRERSVLAALGAFHATFDVDAAEQVVGTVFDEPIAPVLARLVDSSLVAVAGTPGTYRLLEVIRSVAVRALDVAPERDPIQAAHAAWVGSQLEAVERDAVGPHEQATAERLDALRAEILAALAHAGDTGEPVTTARLVGPLATVLLYRPDHELVDSVGRAADRPGTASPIVCAAAARVAVLQGELPRVELLAHEAIERSSSDDLRDRAGEHLAEHALGVLRLYEGRFEEARRWFARVAADDTASIASRLDAVGGLGLACCYGGRLDEAAHVASQLAASAEAVDSDTYRAFARYVDGEHALARGDHARAADALGAAAELAWSAGARFVWGIASTVLASVLVRHRPPEEARKELPVLLDRWRRTATWPQLWTTLRLVAELVHDGDGADVALLVLEAAARDEAAPALVGTDAERDAVLRARLGERLGAPAAAGIALAARRLDRVAVLERARAALVS
jgi:tetratricopeptide (TPR) repeat protein